MEKRSIIWTLYSFLMLAIILCASCTHKNKKGTKCPYRVNTIRIQHSGEYKLLNNNDIAIMKEDTTVIYERNIYNRDEYIRVD